METYQPQTSFKERQAFKFVCPPERSLEARILLGQIDGLRLVPPDPEAQVVVSTHLVAGTVEGLVIQGVVPSVSLTKDVLDVLSKNRIAGFSRSTQLFHLNRDRSHEAFQASKENETFVESKDGRLFVSHEWKKTIYEDGTEGYELGSFFPFPSEVAESLLTDLKKNHRLQFKMLKKNIEKRVIEGIGDEGQMQELLKLIEELG